MPRSTWLPRVLVRGGGDLATGILQCLWRAGFPLLATETAAPLAVRRTVALSEAVYDGTARVEDLAARCLAGKERAPRDSAWIQEVEACWQQEFLPILVDPALCCLDWFRPGVLVDATLLKKNADLSPALAPLVIALGPGFSAGKDCHLVIETMRGHRLGRLIFDGEALPNTHVPGIIAGRGRERVLRAPADGIMKNLREIGDLVDQGESVAEILLNDGSRLPVQPEIHGLLRGLLRDGFVVKKGMKIGDVDPRDDELENIDTISDKARALGGAVLSGIFALSEHWMQTEEAGRP